MVVQIHLGTLLLETANTLSVRGCVTSHESVTISSLPSMVRGFGLFVDHDASVSVDGCAHKLPRLETDPVRKFPAMLMVVERGHPA